MGGGAGQELELVLCGLPVIDIDDWRSHCDYKAPLPAPHSIPRLQVDRANPAAAQSLRPLRLQGAPADPA